MANGIVPGIFHARVEEILTIDVSLANDDCYMCTIDYFGQIFAIQIKREDLAPLINVWPTAPTCERCEWFMAYARLIPGCLTNPSNATVEAQRRHMAECHKVGA
jgi:hypothetical protein